MSNGNCMEKINRQLLATNPTGQHHLSYIEAIKKDDEEYLKKYHKKRGRK